MFKFDCQTTPAAIPTRAIEVGTPYGPCFVIRPVDQSVDRIVVDSDGMFNVVNVKNDVGVVGSVERDPAKISSTDNKKNLRRSYTTGAQW